MATNPDKKTSALPPIYASELNGAEQLPLTKSNIPRSINTNHLATYARILMTDKYGQFQQGLIPYTALNEIPISRIVKGVTSKGYAEDSVVNDGELLVYDSSIKRLLLDDLSGVDFYRDWLDSESFGTPDALGVIPFAHRVYTLESETNDGPIVKTYLRWNGQELVEFTPTMPAIIPFSKIINSTDKDANGELIYQILTPSQNADKPYPIPGQNEVVYDSATRLFYLKVIENDDSQSLWKNWQGSSDFGKPKPNGVAPHAFKIYYNIETGEYLQFNGYTLVGPVSPSFVRDELQQQIDDVNDWLSTVFTRARYSLDSFVFVTAYNGGSTEDYINMQASQASLVYSTTARRLLLNVGDAYYLNWADSAIYGTAGTLPGRLGIIPHPWITFVVKEEIDTNVFKTTYRRWNGHKLVVAEPSFYKVVEFDNFDPVDKNIFIPGNNKLIPSRIFFSTEANRFVCGQGVGQYYTDWYGSEAFGVAGTFGITPDKFKTYYCRDTKAFYQWNPTTGTLEAAISPYDAETLLFDRLFDALCHPSGFVETEDRFIGKIMYSGSNKIYHLNGLNLTYQEAVEVVADALRPTVPLSDNIAAVAPNQAQTGRTNLPLDSRGVAALHTDTFNGKSYEVLRVGYPLNNSSSSPGNAIIYSWRAIHACSNLHTILGRIVPQFNYTDENKKLFASCSKLENVDISVPKPITSISLADCPLLTYDSIASIVQNCKSTRDEELSVYLHATTYANFETSALWGLLEQDAYAKKICFYK